MFHTTLSSLHVYTNVHHYTQYNESSLYHVDMTFLFKDVFIFLNSMSVNLVDIDNGKYIVSIIADDEYIGQNIATL